MSPAPKTARGGWRSCAAWPTRSPWCCPARPGACDAASARAQHAQVVAALEAKFPAAAAHLDDARDDILAFTTFPREIWRQYGATIRKV